MDCYTSLVASSRVYVSLLILVNASFLLMLQGHGRSSYSRTPLVTSEPFIAIFVMMSTVREQMRCFRPKALNRKVIQKRLHGSGSRFCYHNLDPDRLPVTAT